MHSFWLTLLFCLTHVQEVKILFQNCLLTMFKNGNISGEVTGRQGHVRDMHNS